jgi:amino acid transporter
VQAFMAIAYVQLMFCLAEIASAISFSGGSYGLSRVILGFYTGFLVGYLELMQYTMYSASTMFYMSNIITTQFNINQWYEPLLWTLFYMLFVVVLTRRKTWWNMVVYFTLLNILLIVIYIFGSLQWVNIKNASLQNSSKLSDNSNWFQGNMVDFITILPVTTWAYGGVEVLALTASSVKNPTVDLPFAMIASVLTLFVLNILIIFIGSTLPPGIVELTDAEFPMNYGYNLIFNCGDSVSTMLIIPAQFLLAFGYTLPNATLLQALSDSNLVPTILNLNNEEIGTKRASYGAAAICLVFCALGYITTDGNTLTNIAVLAEFFTNICTLICFIVFRYNYSESILPTFKNPFGIYGAVFSILVFLFGIISVIGNFQMDDDLSFIVLVCYCSILSLYYFWFAKNDQKFSADEQKSLFKFYVINMNRKKRFNLHKKVSLFKNFSYLNLNNYDCKTLDLRSFSYKNTFSMNKTTFRTSRKIHVTANLTTTDSNN